MENGLGGMMPPMPANGLIADVIGAMGEDAEKYDPDGSYTGTNTADKDEKPVQDADDL